MSLLSTLQIAKNALFAAQTGVQVAANNIANADTPGYVRETLVQTPGPTQRIGGLITGSGVVVQGVVRKVDTFLQQRLRSAASDVASGSAQEGAYVDLESIIGELSDTDLSSSLADFFNSLNDVLNQPEDVAVRNLAVLTGGNLTGQIREMDSRVRELSNTADQQLVNAADEVNQLVTQVAKLNKQIVEAEEGGAIISDAVGLRDKRDAALEELANLVNINAVEEASGAVNVFVDGDYLVFDGTTQLVTAETAMDRGVSVTALRLSKSQGLLRASAGEIAGLITARDDILGGFLNQLESFTGNLIYEFNKVHASGQGLTGYSELLSQYSVADATRPLDEAGLAFTPTHGSFQVTVTDTETGAKSTHDVFVRLSGLEDDTTLTSLTKSLDAIDGLSADISADGQLSLNAESDHQEFSFGNDTSGVLAALGLNTFFSGTDARNIGITAAVAHDVTKLAISRGGIGEDTHNGELLANLLNTPLESDNGLSLAQRYEQWMGETAQASALSQSIAEGYRSFHDTLESKHLGLSGVSLDEEAVNLMAYQRNYQAAAKVISTISEMLDILAEL
jgi:flagellar hook-associated protein 1